MEIPLSTHRALHAGLLLIGALVGTACRRAPTTTAASTACVTPATVRDISGLDGCGKVLELTGGTRLLPFGPVWEKFPAANDQRVTISYEPLTDMMTTCMAGKSVTVTCIIAAPVDK